MAERTLSFFVEITLDRTVSVAEARDYIADAVRSWGGGFHPEDPFFGLDDADVKVKSGRVKASRRAVAKQAEAR